MKLPIYYIDAFTENVFQGNPAAVVVVKENLDSETMQSIAFENNLSETAFVNVSSSPYLIRWFTPTVEVDLCGHATLASSRILFDEYLPSDCSQVIFNSKNRGQLKAFKKQGMIYLDFPADNPKEVQQNKIINQGLGELALKTYRGKDDYLAVFSNEEIIQRILPDFKKLSQLDSRGLIITAPGKVDDFVTIIEDNGEVRGVIRISNEEIPRKAEIYSNLALLLLLVALACSGAVLRRGKIH